MTTESPPKPRPVEIVAKTYQPSKAELEEEIDLTPLAGTSLDDAARMVLAPVDVTTIPRPRSG